MKANHEKLPSTPMIQFSNETVTINQHVYKVTITLNEDWEILEIGHCSPINWVSHPNRLNCHQILSWQDAKPSPTIQDHFWDKGISVDILSVESACQQAKGMKGENQLFQLVLFPDYHSSG